MMIVFLLFGFLPFVLCFLLCFLVNGFVHALQRRPFSGHQTLDVFCFLRQKLFSPKLFFPKLLPKLFLPPSLGSTTHHHVDRHMQPAQRVRNHVRGRGQNQSEQMNVHRNGRPMWPSLHVYSLFDRPNRSAALAQRMCGWIVSRWAGVRVRSASKLFFLHFLFANSFKHLRLITFVAAEFKAGRIYGRKTL